LIAGKAEKDANGKRVEVDPNVWMRVATVFFEASFLL